MQGFYIILKVRIFYRRVRGGNFTHPSLETELESVSPSHDSSHLLSVKDGITKAALFIVSFSTFWSWTLNLAKHATSFAPSPLQRLQHYYEVARHRHGHQYFLPYVSRLSAFSLAFHVYFSYSSKEPMSSSCHLYTAHQSDSKQVSSAIIPRLN